MTHSPSGHNSVPQLFGQRSTEGALPSASVKAPSEVCASAFFSAARRNAHLLLSARMLAGCPQPVSGLSEDDSGSAEESTEGTEESRVRVREPFGFFVGSSGSSCQTQPPSIPLLTLRTLGPLACAGQCRSGDSVVASGLDRDACTSLPAVAVAVIEQPVDGLVSLGAVVGIITPTEMVRGLGVGFAEPFDPADRCGSVVGVDVMRDKPGQ